MTTSPWEETDEDEAASEGESLFDDYFDDPYGELDQDYDDDEEEEHPLSTRQSRRQRNYRPDD